MLKRENFHDYQNKGVEFIQRRKKCALWFIMGGGKSATSLTAVSDLYDGFAINKVLVIAPLRVANSVWHKEAKDWEHLQHLTFSICTGALQSRIEGLNKKADVYVINRENIVWLVDYYKARWPFDMVIIDEADSFKNQKSKRWKSFRKVLPKINYLVELTGTPSPNGYLDLWPQIYLLDNGISLGRSATAYKSRYFIGDYMGYSYSLAPGSKGKIQKAISHLVYCPEEVVKVEPVNIKRSAKLPPKLYKQYKELEREFFLEIHDEEIEVLNTAALSNKLTQFCNGNLYGEDQQIHHVHNIKIDILKEIMEEADGPVLVAYNYKSDLKMIQENFPKATVLDKDAKTIDRWNEGKIEMLLAHPASAGHGLNLQKGGSILVWFGLTWNLAFYEQFVARLARQGQKHTVRNIHIVIEDAMDEKILEAVANKALTQRDLLEYMQSLKII